MAKSPPSGPPSTAGLRAAVVVVVLLTLAATGLQVMTALAAANRPDLAGPVPPLFVPAALTLTAGLALAAIIEGLARVAGRTHTVVVNDNDAAAPAVNRLVATVTELRAALPAMLADAKPPAIQGPAPADPQPAEPPPNPSVALLERMVQLLEELKELALLDESQRQARGQMARQRRKTGRLDEAAVLIHRREWEQADALLMLLESLHPGDADVLARRNELDDARTAAREARWRQLVRQVEDLTALNSYDEALSAIADFREQHPAHTDAAGLSAQVTADRDDHVERTVTGLLGEIKTAVDAKQWRMALDGSQQFLGRFPDHPRAERIRSQMPAIQRNADVEERLAQEDRIKELARAGKFAESADLCEDLLGRFPESPQAPSLRILLPKLRERSAMAEAVVE